MEEPYNFDCINPGYKRVDLNNGIPEWPEDVGNALQLFSEVSQSTKDNRT